METIKNYLEAVRKEMAKVSWPTKDELWSNTGIVALFSVILAAFIFLIDRVYTTILEFLY
jgi:preprotein translocase subunit SecE